MSFDETIIHCASPALCGIKPANLFSMSEPLFSSGRHKMADWKPYFSRRHTYFVVIHKKDGRVLFFVYDDKLLRLVLAESRNLQYLASKGYPVEDGFQAILAELLHRLASSPSFPHEVGLFLGYPLADVMGFESQAAKGAAYSGFWKVYGNVEGARHTMNLYKTCSSRCMEWLAKGLSVPLAAEKYSTFLEEIK